MGIGETLRRDLAKLVTREAGEQAKTACGILQLCAGLKAGIEGETQAVGQRRLERVRSILDIEEVEASDEEEESVNVAEVMGNLTIETAEIEEEAAENLWVALGMEIAVAGGDEVE